MPQYIRKILLDETDKAAKKMHREFSLMGDFGYKIMRIADEVNSRNPY